MRRGEGVSRGDLMRGERSIAFRKTTALSCYNIRQVVLRPDKGGKISRRFIGVSWSPQSHLRWAHHPSRAWVGASGEGVGWRPHYMHEMDKE